MAENTGPQLTTTAISLARRSVSEDDDDILAIVHRLPGVDQVWMEIDALMVVHDPQKVTRDTVVNALDRRGFRVMEA